MIVFEYLLLMRMSRLARGMEFNGETNKTLNGASGLMKMVYSFSAQKNEYDCKLEWYAQIWADKCKFEHSNRWERPNQGQNLFMTSFTDYDDISILHTAIELWWKELEEYGIPGDAMFSDELWRSKGSRIGHFTQVSKFSKRSL
ncbi:hypothetical protein DICVIV_10952 [Dictyocaulus viviparus]|uniref:SCP domain-containing protein n=1 Tax=Dictyocaulus viviparus TaxID=29172 RepID=A0A0D8XEH1_DICVI|nr:hypothetical protein DICVIV_10952 [Dictyocaulus viviparus]